LTFLIEDHKQFPMGFKRNQVENAIFGTLGAEGERLDEFRFRLRRLLAADRDLGRNATSDDDGDRYYAFYSGKPRGKGWDVNFSAYEAFALLAAVKLLEHGLPQTTAVKIMRRARPQLEAAHAQSLAEDPNRLFDQEAIHVQSKHRMATTDNTHPIFLTFLKPTGSPAGNRTGGRTVVLYRSEAELMNFIHGHLEHSDHAPVFTVFEFVGVMHALSANLARTCAIKRGRRAETEACRLGRLANLRSKTCAEAGPAKIGEKANESKSKMTRK
jgi:hypothetical protein